MIKNQLITDDYAIYESDCMYVMPMLPDEILIYLFTHLILQDFIIIPVL